MVGQRGESVDQNTETSRIRTRASVRTEYRRLVLRSLASGHRPIFDEDAVRRIANCLSDEGQKFTGDTIVEVENGPLAPIRSPLRLVLERVAYRCVVERQREAGREVGKPEYLLDRIERRAAKLSTDIQDLMRTGRGDKFAFILGSYSSVKFNSSQETVGDATGRLVDIQDAARVARETPSPLHPGRQEKLKASAPPIRFVYYDSERKRGRQEKRAAWFVIGCLCEIFYDLTGSVPTGQETRDCGGRVGGTSGSCGKFIEEFFEEVKTANEPAFAAMKVKGRTIETGIGAWRELSQ